MTTTLRPGRSRLARRALAGAVLAVSLGGPLAAPPAAHGEEAALGIAIAASSGPSVVHLGDALERSYAVEASGQSCYVRLRVTLAAGSAALAWEADGEGPQGWQAFPDGCWYRLEPLAPHESATFAGTLRFEGSPALLEHLEAGEEAAIEEVAEVEAVPVEAVEPNWSLESPWVTRSTSEEQASSALASTSMPGRVVEEMGAPAATVALAQTGDGAAKGACGLAALGLLACGGALGGMRALSARVRAGRSALEEEE